MRPMRVLLLDRDPERREELVRLLRSADHRVDAAVDPSSVAASIDPAEFDALLIDLAWPDIDLPALKQAVSPSDAAQPDSLEAAEQRHLRLVLRHTSGNKRKAAHLLGISRSTLLNKVRKYQLE